jgi:uncharacterized DUF497 family protein
MNEHGGITAVQKQLGHRNIAYSAGYCQRTDEESRGLSVDRRDLLFKFIQEEVQVNSIYKLDIERGVLKWLLPEKYKLLSYVDDLSSKCGLHEYDPPKNGQNIIKHGIGFCEAVSYSKNFGSLTVPCSDKNDGERLVIFSDLDTGDNGNNLQMPLKNMSGLVCVITIAEQRSTGFKFISSRRMSSKNYRNDMKKDFKNIFVNDPKAKKEFIDDCVKTVERDLLPSILKPSSEKAV